MPRGLRPCRKPSSFFSLRILRALAGSVVAVAALGLVFSLAPRRSDIPGETAAGGGMPEGVMYLHEGPRHLAERREPREPGDAFRPARPGFGRSGEVRRNVFVTATFQ